MPRSRAVEAQQLIRYFAEFTRNDDSGPTSPIFVDPNQLQAAADVIQKLHMMAQVSYASTYPIMFLAQNLRQTVAELKKSSHDPSRIKSILSGYALAITTSIIIIAYEQNRNTR